MDGQLLSETFVELTDTMVADFDVIDFLHVLTDRSVQLLDVSAAGLLLADPRGSFAWSPPPARQRGCWSYFSCRTTRVPAWTASALAGPSPPPTWRPMRSAGPGSPLPPSRPGSPPCRPCHEAARPGHRRAEPVPRRPGCPGSR